MDVVLRNKIMLIFLVLTSSTMKKNTILNKYLLDLNDRPLRRYMIWRLICKKTRRIEPNRWVEEWTSLGLNLQWNHHVTLHKKLRYDHGEMIHTTQFLSTIFLECPLVLPYLLIYPCHQLSIEYIKVIHNSLDLFLYHQLHVACHLEQWNQVFPMYILSILFIDTHETFLELKLNHEWMEKWKMKTSLQETNHCEPLVGHVLPTQ
jgi:hypothetical protein